MILPQVFETNFPHTLQISDGLDGSGSHQIYNQRQESVNFNPKISSCLSLNSFQSKTLLIV